MGRVKGWTTVDGTQHTGARPFTFKGGSKVAAMKLNFDRQQKLAASKKTTASTKKKAPANPAAKPAPKKKTDPAKPAPDTTESPVTSSRKKRLEARSQKKAMKNETTTKATESPVTSRKETTTNAKDKKSTNAKKKETTTKDAPTVSKEHVTTDDLEAKKDTAQTFSKKDFSSKTEYLNNVFAKTGGKRKSDTGGGSGKKKSKTRHVGSRPTTAKQQFDGAARTQYQLTLKNEVNMQAMMTPLTASDNYTGGDRDRQVDEAFWPAVIPIKGFYTEAAPNSNGSAPLKRLARGKIVLLVPSIQRGYHLHKALAGVEEVTAPLGPSSTEVELVTTEDELMEKFGGKLKKSCSFKRSNASVKQVPETKQSDSFDSEATTLEYEI